MRNAWAAATCLLWALGATACGDDGGAPPVGMEIALYAAPDDVDPFQDVAFLRFLVTGDGLERTIEHVVDYEPGGTTNFDGVTFTAAGQTRQLTVEGWSAGADGQPRNLLSRGRSAPVSVQDGQSPAQFDVLVARVNHFLPLVSSDTLAPQTLSQGRVGHTATKTEAGEIVVAGGGVVTGRTAAWWDGEGFSQLTSSVEGISALRHDIEGRSPMLAPRAWHTATAIGSGQVIFAGGFGASGEAIDRVELYNPPGVLDGTAKELQRLAVPRAGHTATLLDADERLILFVGGDDEGTWELWDPEDGSRGAVPLPDGRQRRFHGATTFFLSGRTEPAVLISGGESATTAHATAMLFDSVARQMVGVGEAMPRGGRTHHSATYVPDRGFIYLAGGFDSPSRDQPLNGIDVFVVDSQDFITGNDGFRMRTPRGGHAATLMPNNTVIITGGEGPEPAGAEAGPLGSIEVIFEFVDAAQSELRIEVASSFDPSGDSPPVPFMPAARLGHRSVTLPNGMALLIGGARRTGAEGSFGMVTELTVYNPAQ